jgi:hypothetical protein
MVVIDSDSMDVAAARPSEPDCSSFEGRRAKWCGGATAMGHQVSLMTATHELLHVLGINPDMYGSDDLNLRYTTMCSTIVNSPNVKTTWHLDPFHKMKLGWCEPRTYNGLRTDSFVVKSHQVGNVDAPVLLYNPNDGPRKVFHN